MTRARSWAAGALAAALIAGCGNDRAGEKPAVSTSQIEELSATDAERQNLTRDDVVVVNGPRTATGQRARVRLDIDVPAAANASEVQVQLSGTCEARIDGKQDVTLALTGGGVRPLMHLRLPKGQDDCIAVADVLVPGRPETGRPHIVEMRGS